MKYARPKMHGDVLEDLCLLWPINQGLTFCPCELLSLHTLDTKILVCSTAMGQCKLRYTQNDCGFAFLLMLFFLCFPSFVKSMYNDL